jgi:hypothetical protein
MVLCNSHTRSYVMSASFQAGVAWRNLNMFNKHHLPKRVLVRLDYSCFSFRIYKNPVKKSWSIMMLSFRSQNVFPRKPCCWWTPMSLTQKKRTVCHSHFASSYKPINTIFKHVTASRDSNTYCHVIQHSSNWEYICQQAVNTSSSMKKTWQL